MDPDQVNDLLSDAASTFPKNAEEVADWLTTTKAGNSILRDAFYSTAGQSVVAELLDRNQTYVLVKVHADGWVEVMCDDRRVQVEILDLPPSLPHDGLVNELADLLARPRFREANYWPTNCRATKMVRMLPVRQWVEAENKRDCELFIIDGLRKLEES